MNTIDNINIVKEIKQTKNRSLTIDATKQDLFTVLFYTHVIIEDLEDNWDEVCKSKVYLKVDTKEKLEFLLNMLHINYISGFDLTACHDDCTTIVNHPYPVKGRGFSKC